MHVFLRYAWRYVVSRCCQRAELLSSSVLMGFAERNILLIC